MELTRFDRNRSLWHMILAPTIWAIHFCVTYATAAIFCAKAAGRPARSRPPVSPSPPSPSC